MAALEQKRALELDPPVLERLGFASAGSVGRLMAGEATREPIVDIGMPTHGRPRYLCEAVESVLAQSFDSWRLTVSENGPGGDHIRAILQPYLSDPRVALSATGSNISRPDNATRTITAGHAPYVALLHDDDRWDMDFLALRVRFLESNPTCGLVFSHCNYMSETGEPVFRFTVDLKEGLQPRMAFLRLLYRQNVIAMPTVLSRRSAYETVGPAFSQSLLFDDYEMWLRIAAGFDVGFLNVCDASYRIHTAQTTHEWVKHMGEQRLELLNAVDTWLPQDFPTVERRRARSGAYFRASYDAFWLGERQHALGHLVRAFQEHPLAVLDPKMVALAADSRMFRARQRALWKRTSTIDSTTS